MGKKRDVIEEILEINSRLIKKDDPDTELVYRYAPLYRAFHYVKENINSSRNERFAEIQNELLKHFPVSLVALLEGYFRLLIRDVIDKHEPFRQNISKFGELRFDVSSVLAIDSSKVSLGEFVAHILPLNDLVQINRVMSVIVERDFLEDIKAFVNINYEVIGKISKDKNNAALMVKNISDMFRIRHIICHEVSTNEQLSVLKVDEMFKSVTLFTLVTDVYLKHAIKGDFDGLESYKRFNRKPTSQT